MQQSLRNDVTAIATPGGRVAGSTGHARTRTLLCERLSEAGLVSYSGGGFELPYKFDGQEFVNVIAKLPGTDPELPPVLLAAHYDTCGPFSGADDNAAAIAILLNIIGTLRDECLERSVLFAFFDAEEPPYYLTPAMGSVRFYETQRLGDIHCAIVMDLCGHDVPLQGLGDLLFVTGMESGPAWEDALRCHEPEAGLRIVPTLNRYIGDLSDHYVFRINRKPYLFLSCGRWQHYHQPTDTPEKLNYEKMESIARWLVEITAASAQAPLREAPYGYDPVATELYFIRKAVGPFLDMLGFDPQDRADIDMMVPMVVNQLGL